MSLQLDLALKLVKEGEGFRAKPYRCTAGKLTQGYGRNLEAHPLSEDEQRELNADGTVSISIAEKWALSELIDCEVKLNQNIIYQKLAPIRKAVLLDMCFNIGYAGLMKFKKMWFALSNHDYAEASRQMKDSKWYTDVGTRAKRNVEMMISDKIVTKE